MSNYKLVPVEPTAEMVEVAREHHEGEAYLPVSVYKAMLAAAPAVQGEPVAYISHTSEGDILGWERQFDAPSHTPLYTAPQPAVQAEPVGWHTEDHLDDKSATTYSAEVAQRWRDKGWPVWPLYTAQQPAPDVDVLVDALEGLLDVIDESRGVSGYHLNGEIAEWDEFQEVYDATAALDTYYKGEDV